MCRNMVVAVLLTFALAGCVSIRNPFVFDTEPGTDVSASATTPLQKPAAKPGAQVAQPGEPETIAKEYFEDGKLTKFPSSKNPAKGEKIWTKMGLFPFKGTVDHAIKQMPLDAAQKTKFKTDFVGGKCQQYEIKDGEKFVIDGLNFTVGSVHKTRGNVAAELKNLPSKKVTICHLGDGIYAGQFDGCKNYFWVFSTPPEKVKKTRMVPNPEYKKPKPAPRVSITPNACPKETREFHIHMWNEQASPIIAQCRQAALANFAAPNAFSRSRCIVDIVKGERAAGGSLLWHVPTLVAAKVTVNGENNSAEVLADMKLLNGSGTLVAQYSMIKGKVVHVIFEQPVGWNVLSPVGAPLEVRVYPQEFEKAACSFEISGTAVKK